MSAKKKIIYGLIGIMVVAAVINQQLDKNKLQQMAEDGGFENISEYESAKSKNIDTKEEYNGYLENKAIEELKLAEARGFISFEEYTEAKSAGMPTKELYDKYLTQKLATEKQEAEQKLVKEKQEADQKLVKEKQEAERKLAEKEEKAERKLAKEKQQQEESRKSKALSNIANENILTKGNVFINSVAKYNYYNFVEKKKFSERPSETSRSDYEEYQNLTKLIENSKGRNFSFNCVRPSFTNEQNKKYLYCSAIRNSIYTSTLEARLRQTSIYLEYNESLEAKYFDDDRLYVDATFDRIRFTPLDVSFFESELKPGSSNLKYMFGGAIYFTNVIVNVGR